MSCPSERTEVEQKSKGIQEVSRSQTKVDRPDQQKGPIGDEQALAGEMILPPETARHAR
jgi:hypothetical protein